MTMSNKMQEAAVEAALQEGKTLDTLESENPELANGIKIVRDKQTEKTTPKPRGSGSMRATYLKPPRI